MNLSSFEASKLVDEYLSSSSIMHLTNTNIFFVPDCYLSIVGEKLNKFSKSNSLYYGAQNCSIYQNGAFTGDVSASMLSSLGTKWVLIGHSERRKYFNETNQEITFKIINAFNNGLSVLLCVGESKDIRESGKHLEYVQNQLISSLEKIVFNFNLEQINKLNLIIAYEPIWSIGTGIVASNEEINEMHKSIKNLFLENKNLKLLNHSESIPVLYGGSISDKNVSHIVELQSVNGILVGGASLDAKIFNSICNQTLEIIKE